MKTKAEITSLLQKRILILDGAMGTELTRRGLPADACPEAWGAKNPAAIQSVHREYLEAGADIVYTATLGGNPWKLGAYGEGDVIGLNRELARLAKQTAGEKKLVAGDIGPSGRFVEPFGDLDFEEAVEGFKQQVRGLLEGGVDLFIIETMFDIQEARAALIAVRETGPAFTMVSLTFQSDGRTLGGTTPPAALITLQALGADAVGVNCGSGPEGMLQIISALKPYATVPVFSKPNAGLPRLENGITVFPMGPEEFADYTAAFADAGANFLGGCCGTTPEHIRLLAGRLKKQPPVPPHLTHLAALSGSREALILSDHDPVHIIGERINPTGKKALQEELKTGRLGIVERLAREQKAQGAALLDVNAGVPGADEADLLRRMVSLLSLKSDVPLVIDSAQTEAVVRCLRLYPGRALVNSVSGEKEKMENLLPAAAFYGAMLIVLPVTGRSLPLFAKERVAIAENIIASAEHAGYGREDLVVDGLTLALASQPGLARETLETIALCREKLKVHTILGLSNVSFGLPQRRLINTAFLSQAAAAGLTFAIANPGEPGLMASKLAADLLRNADPNAKSYLAYCAALDAAPRTATGAPTPTAVDPAHEVEWAVLEGWDDKIEALVDRAVAAGIEPMTIIDQYMVPAITRVGQLFAEKKYYLPQLLLCAGTMEKGCKRLLPLMETSSLGKKGRVLIATVRGDVHDIGKNIVALLLRNFGFEVVDLGKDISAEIIVAQAKELLPDAIGLSALMTTTMERMKETIELARREKIDAPFILGGAVVTEEYARSIGAHYAADGVAAAAVLEQILQKG